MKKQLDFVDTDVEILDLGDLATDNTDLYIDQLTSAYDWPPTHSFSTPTAESHHLGSLLSAQAAFDATTLADKFLLVPPTYTPVESYYLEGSPVHTEHDGSTVSNPSTSVTHTDTPDTSPTTGLPSTGDTDTSLAAAPGGTESPHSDADADAVADALAGTEDAPTASAAESASATAPGESVYAEPTSATATEETPAPTSAPGATGEAGASTTEPSPTSPTTVETGTVSVELGAVSAPTPAATDAVSVDLGPSLPTADTPSADPIPPVLATVPVLPAVSSAAAPPVANDNSDSDSDFDMADASGSTRFAPPKFQGLTTENAKDWLREFEHYCLYKDMNGPKKLALFKVLLTSSAAIWLENLSLIHI